MPSSRQMDALDRSSSSDDDDDGMAHPGSLKVAAGMPAMEVSIPESVYGSVIVLPLLIETHGVCDWCSQKGVLWCSLLVNWLIQSYFLYCIYTITREEIDDMADPDSGCQKLDVMLRILCLMYFCLYVLMDVEETIDLIELLWHLLPDSKGGSELLKYENIDGAVQLVGGGFAKSRKIVLMLTVLIPKLLVAMAMLYLGSRYLSGSGSNADLFLNSLALTFIIDVDEMLFAAMTPRMGRRVLAAVPPFISESKPGIMRFMDNWGPYLKVFVACGMIPLSNMIKKCGDAGLS